MIITVKNYEAPPFCESEALRYSGSQKEDAIAKLLFECKNEIWDKLAYKVCYCENSFSNDGEHCDFGVFSLKSYSLSKNLEGCRRVIIFAATLGIELDRQIAKYGRISPSKALMLQAIGGERIESLCDTFCNDIKTKTSLNLKPRFSPGYGDLPLSSQKEIFRLLDTERKIGLTLNDSLVMSPSKSVTAILGLY